MTGFRPPPSDDEPAAPTLTELSKWAYLVLVIVASVVYYAIVLPQLSEHGAADVDWQVPMLWVIGATIVGSIVLAIVIAIVTAIITRREPENGDVRDKQIERYGDRISQGIMAFGTLGVLLLAMLEVDWFWIGNAVYLIGLVASIIGTIASLVAYRGRFRG